MTKKLTPATITGVAAYHSSNRWGVTALDIIIDIIKSVGAGVIANFITPYVRKWLDELRKKWQQ